MNDIVEAEPIDMVLTAMVGFSGLEPTIHAIRARKKICLANKETLVVAGELICQLAQENRVPILPVDSEHSAIFQCLQGCPDNALKKLIITASGGAFFGKSKEELKNVTVEDALKHPNWNMGAKITIDSATMMNKGLEVIEASWLFDVGDEKIDVVVHRESIIHSMIQLKDNAVIAQLGTADMRVPIQYALTYPERLPSPVKELDLTEIAKLSFYPPDNDTFECLEICRRALRKGGLYPAVANAANEAAVQMFLERKIGFLDIPDIVGKAVENFSSRNETISLQDILEADRETRQEILCQR